MTVWLRQLRLMTFKELRQLWRDRPLAIFIVYIFTLDIIIAAGAGSGDLRDVRVLVHDADHSAASRELVYLLRPPYFKLVGEVSDPLEGLRRLDSGDVMLVLDIPSGFGRTLGLGHEPARAQLLIDTSRAIRGYLAASYVTRIVERLGVTIVALREGASSPARPIVLEPRVWYNPDLNPAWFLTISELLTVMTVACIVLPGAALVREKERGTIEQLLVSPLVPFQVMFAKILAMVLVTVAGTAVALLLVMQPMFGVPLRGSVVLFLALTALYAFTNAGLGLVAATFARNSAQLGMIVLLLVTPIIMLSGTWVTVESMPGGLRAATLLSPLRHFIDIAYGILLRGNGLYVLWRSVLSMTLLGLGLFGAGLWRFRRQSLHI
jgi:ABC-2 type transport system permease protein